MIGLHSTILHIMTIFQQWSISLLRSVIHQLFTWSFSFSGLSILYSVIPQAKCNLNCQDIHLKTPLHLAVEENKSATVSLLLENSAKCDVIDKKGESPFDLAVRFQHSDIIQQMKTQNTESEYSVLVPSFCTRYCSVYTVYTHTEFFHLLLVLYPPWKVVDMGVYCHGWLCGR